MTDIQSHNQGNLMPGYVPQSQGDQMEEMSDDKYDLSSEESGSFLSSQNSIDPENIINDNPPRDYVNAIPHFPKKDSDLTKSRPKFALNAAKDVDIIPL
jgi:hypothetical protein